MQNIVFRTCFVHLKNILLSSESCQTWMCGGSMLIAPCSHVGHIFRKTNPIPSLPGLSNPAKKNSIRLAEVWLDEYKIYYYQRFNFQLVRFFIWICYTFYFDISFIIVI